MEQKTLKTFLLCWVIVMITAGAGSRKTFADQPAKPGSERLRYEEPKYLTGTIFSPESNQLLFKFKRAASRTGSCIEVQRGFTYPDGRLAAQERVVYERNALVSYELKELQIGASGSATIRRAPNDSARDSIEFQYRAAGSHRLKTRTESLRENTLIADMVGPFLQSHWEELRRGESVKCRYIVVPRTETVGFTFIKESENKWEGRDAVSIRMQASSRLLAALVAPLYFTVEQAPPHRVLSYTGRTTPKIQAGDKWQDLDAVTVFDWQSSH